GFVILALRSCLLLLLIVACFLPFYLFAGQPTLGFLRYHRDRGLEIGSLYGSLALAMQALGYPIRVEYSYGSINLRSDVAATLVRLAPALTIGALAAVSLLLLGQCLRL